MGSRDQNEALDRARDTWEEIGKADPLWGVDTSRPFQMDGQEEPFFEAGEREINRILKMVKSLDGEPLFGRVLDFGCGVGRLSLPLSKQFQEVVGLDVSKPMIAQADEYRKQLPRERASQIRFVCNQEPDLALFESESFDFVLSLVTLQHLRPVLIRHYLEEFLRVLKPSGILVFQVPSSREALWKRVPRIGKVLRYLPGRSRDTASPSPPEMEMHGLPREEVHQIVRNAGRKVLSETADEWAAGWKSYTYYVG